MWIANKNINKIRWGHLWNGPTILYLDLTSIAFLFVTLEMESGYYLEIEDLGREKSFLFVLFVCIQNIKLSYKIKLVKSETSHQLRQNNIYHVNIDQYLII